VIVCFEPKESLEALREVNQELDNKNDTKEVNNDMHKVFLNSASIEYAELTTIDAEQIDVNIIQEQMDGWTSRLILNGGMHIIVVDDNVEPSTRSEYVSEIENMSEGDNDGHDTDAEDYCNQDESDISMIRSDMNVIMDVNNEEEKIDESENNKCEVDDITTNNH
jgi:hypothetical protein